jgi:hypothetical protein
VLKKYLGMGDIPVRLRAPVKERSCSQVLYPDFAGGDPQMSRPMFAA